MYTAVDIAKYLNDKHDISVLSAEMKTHKIAYYIQGWSLAWTGKPAFQNNIEAWAKGPVDTHLRSFLRRQDITPKTITEHGLLSIIDTVVDFYGHYSGGQLSVMTHKDEPWLDAREGLKPNQHGNSPITDEKLMKYFTKISRSNEVTVPAPPELNVTSVDVDEVDDIIDQQMTRWADVLDRLSRA